MLAQSDGGVITVSLVYNPLDINDRTDTELLFQPGKSLSHYLDGLPGEIEWGVTLNANPIRSDVFGLVFPSEGDSLFIIPVPEGGGDDGKSILALVATVALSVFAPYAAGLITGATSGLAFTLAQAAISIAGGLLINALIPKPDTSQDSPSYGIDGPKNTSTEGVPVPLLYGEHAFGGNLIDLYTENAVDDDGKSIQFLYGRTVISEGPIDSISDLKLNDLPVDSFEEVEIDYRLGDAKQPQGDWFGDTVTLINQGRDLSENWQGYTTTTEVDKLRLDFAFPLGLYYMRKGKKRWRTVTIEARYRKVGDLDWITFEAQNVMSQRRSADEACSGFKVTASVHRRVERDDNDRWVSGVSSAVVEMRYRKRGSSDPWVSAGQREIDFGGVSSPGSSETVIWNVSDLPLQAWDIDFVDVNNDGVTMKVQSIWIEAPTTEMTVGDRVSTAIRRSFKSRVLDEAFYEVEFRRTTPGRRHRGEHLRQGRSDGRG